MPFTALALRTGSVPPEVPARHMNRERATVEPGGHSDQAAAARLAVVRPPDDPLRVRVIGMYGSRDGRAVPGGAGGSGESRLGAGEHLGGAAVDHVTDAVTPVRLCVID